MKFLVINGPNLNLLGEREPDIYGSESLQAINDEMIAVARVMGHELSFFQSSSEGSIVDSIHTARHEYDGVILNAGAYTHYSYAIHDAIAAIKIPVVEVHLSNIADREDFRRNSVIASACAGTVAGFGKYSYFLAINALDYIAKEKK